MQIHSCSWKVFRPTLCQSAKGNVVIGSKGASSFYWQKFCFSASPLSCTDVMKIYRTEGLNLFAIGDNCEPDIIFTWPTHWNKQIRTHRDLLCRVSKYLIIAITFALQIVLWNTAGTNGSSHHSALQFRCQAVFRENQEATTFRRNCSRNSQGKDGNHGKVVVAPSSCPTLNIVWSIHRRSMVISLDFSRNT